MSRTGSFGSVRTRREQGAKLLHWHSPSGAPVLRRRLCGVCQPTLKRQLHTPQFVFHEATVLLIVAGQLGITSASQHLSLETPGELLLVPPNTRADLVKTPGDIDRPFRSILLTLSAELLDVFHRTRQASPPIPPKDDAWKTLPLDEDLSATFYHVIESVEKQEISDIRLQYRLLDFLTALAERGHVFTHLPLDSPSQRLRTLIFEAPEQNWTAETAGKTLAMSPATLRRRLAAEQTRFEDLLIDVRMHHAMMLLQTTRWDMTRIAEACGYKSRARFSERFQKRFGYAPSAIR
ncbi:Urease operon transcriptional activator [Serratia marcescens]|uniref:AraC family transcriptional regulator n=1 Tax=Serratia marcescens TaxID=615 RepID=A0A656VFL5_SERMA|nr:AraC family transcriptional regulator [Serratia marcescens]NSL12972.1 helix-turn-helix transcriptional regulator [Serratia marcescens]CAI1712513.1 Urease operon transcriptional activator [Serratia marcescens]CAI2472900.1 Urease operon transcriptional activator [Serratia marcescens]CVG71208.1 Urease operon transcriptional activator [Serratia marcescens]